MVFFIVLGLIVAVTISVMGYLFFALNKEEQEKQAETPIPFTDLDKLRKEISSKSGLYGSQNPKPAVTAAVPQISLEDHKKRLKELEDEIRSLTQKLEKQSLEAKERVDALTKENSSLKSLQTVLEGEQQKLNEVQNKLTSLNTENFTLQTKLESSNTKILSLEEEMAALKIQLGEEISRTKETIIELNRDKEDLLAISKSDTESRRMEIEDLKSEASSLNEKNLNLEKMYQKVLELNSHLIEKNGLLDHELIKARAQSSGLERVSHNYKNQLEDFLRKVNRA